MESILLWEDMQDRLLNGGILFCILFWEDRLLNGRYFILGT